MSIFKTYWGDEVPDQGRFRAKYRTLFGEAPKVNAILSGYIFGSAVVFDGETWRELDLLAMQAEANNHGHEAT